MAGLLDMVNDPRQAFLTNLGVGLLSAGGPSARPVSLGQAFGAAMPGALQGAQQAQTYGEQQQLKEMQLAELKRKQEEYARKLAAQQTFRGTLPSSEGAMFDVDPDAYFQSLREANKPMVVGEGGSVFQGGKSVFTNPKTEKPNDFERALVASGILPGTPQYMQMMRQYATKQATHTPATQVTIGEGKGSMEAWKSLGGTIPEKQTIAEQSKNAISRIAQIREALPRAYTGAGATLKDRYAQAASLFGVQVPELAAGQTVDNAVTSLTAAIAKTFGANPSVYETQLLELLSGKRTFEPKAMEVILENIENDARGRIRSFNSQIDAFKDPALQAFRVEEPEKQKPKQPVFSRPNQAAINKLRMQPSLRSDFDAEFGPGASARILGK